MPWEIDYCLILFDTLSRAKKKTEHYYKIDIALNLSNYCINWEQSKLDKDFFIEKMQSYINIRGREIMEHHKNSEGLIRELIEFKLEVNILVNLAFMNDTTFQYASDTLFRSIIQNCDSFHK
jgi:hypothetical protein